MGTAGTECERRENREALLLRRLGLDADVRGHGPEGYRSGGGEDPLQNPPFE
jgi:hypothetical protein